MDESAEVQRERAFGRLTIGERFNTNYAPDFAMRGTMLVLMLGLAFAGDLQRLLSVKGMSCSAWPPQVKRELEKVPGVKSAHVDLRAGQAKVVAADGVKTGDLVRAVNKAGFKAEAEERR